MKATDFEYRHQTLLHLLLVTISFLTYVLDPDDIVWALVRNQPNPRLLERLLFALATLLIGAGAALRTWARAYPTASPPSSQPLAGPYRYLRYPEYRGNLLFSIGLAFLAPLWGFILLVFGEALLVFRLIQREKSVGIQQPVVDNSKLLPTTPPPYTTAVPAWRDAFRRESGKWGLLLTMIVFTLLLRDRVAEVLAGASFLLWLALNYSSRERIAR